MKLGRNSGVLFFFLSVTHLCSVAAVVDSTSTGAKAVSQVSLEAAVTGDSADLFAAAPNHAPYKSGIKRGPPSASDLSAAGGPEPLAGSAEVAPDDSHWPAVAEHISAEYLGAAEPRVSKKLRKVEKEQGGADNVKGLTKAAANMSATNKSVESTPAPAPATATPATTSGLARNSSSSSVDVDFKKVPLTAKPCLNDCSGHGVCDVMEAKCKCTPGWSGQDCSKKLCPDSCSGHGNCVNGTCKCLGPFVGDNCAKATCPNDCSKHGNCDQSTGVCDCDLGYEGTDCSTLACPKNCSSRGRCSNGTCMCMPGFKGNDCSLQECIANCTGHGVCNSKTGECECNPPYSGDDCSIADAKCPGDCTGHGSCNKITGKCVCDFPWLQPNCATASCPKTSDGPCDLHGTCDKILGQCMCEPGYTGVDCSEMSCPVGKNNLTCSGHGQCNLRLGRCMCEGKWAGDTCATVPCPDGCSGNGNCREDGTCRCDPNHNGPNCNRTKCPQGDNGKECSGHGSCDGQTGHCACEKQLGSEVFGFDGAACNIAICKADCTYQGHKRGECDADAARCRCYGGFHGDDCRFKDCLANCSGHGTCDRYNGKCECIGEWAGDTCEVSLAATPAPPPPPSKPANPARTILIHPVVRHSKELQVENLKGFAVGRVVRINGNDTTEEENYITAISPHDVDQQTSMVSLVTAGRELQPQAAAGSGSLFLKWELRKSHLEGEPVWQLPDGYIARSAPVWKAAPQGVVPKKASEPAIDALQLAVILLVGSMTTVVVVGLVINYVHGKRGADAVPFYATVIEQTTP